MILSTATDYFYTLFTTALGDQTKGEIKIANIDGATLDKVVKCFYTGNIEISVENVEALLAAASFLLFPYLQEKCTEFLGRPGIVNIVNCVGIWAIARLYEYEDLKELTFPFILRHFREIVACEEFLRLKKSDLKELLENNELQVGSEEDVFNAIVDWAQFDLAERKTEFPDLVRCARLHLLPSAVSSAQKSRLLTF